MNGAKAGDRRLAARYRLLYPLIARLPRTLGDRLASAAGRARLRRDRGLREAADRGLARVFPAMPPVRRRAVVQAQQAMLSREILDVYRLRSLTTANLDSVVRLDGLAHLDHARSSGRPIILYSAHFGRLIMPAMALGVMGIRTSCLTADIDHPRTPEPERRYLAFKLREMQRLMGGDMVGRGDSPRRLYRVLRDKGILIVILDAPAARGDAVEQFPFLGGTARLATGTLRLARRTDAVLLPYFALESDGPLLGRILPPVEIRDLDDGAALRALFAPVERHIRQHPDHWWLWPILNAIWQPAAPAAVSPVAEERERAPKLA